MACWRRESSAGLQRRRVRGWWAPFLGPPSSALPRHRLECRERGVPAVSALDGAVAAKPPSNRFPVRPGGRRTEVCDELLDEVRADFRREFAAFKRLENASSDPIPSVVPVLNGNEALAMTPLGAACVEAGLAPCEAVADLYKARALGLWLTTE
eukprot:Polyplicarium_translucidae@DN3286_c0_g1_i2.p1